MGRHSPCLWAIPPRPGVRAQEMRRGWAGKASTILCLSLSFQVVDLLNQAALITNDSKITVLKQVRGQADAGLSRTRGEGMGTREKEDMEVTLVSTL